MSSDFTISNEFVRATGFTQGDSVHRNGTVSANVPSPSRIEGMA